MKTIKALLIILIIFVISIRVIGQKNDCLNQYSFYDTITVDGNYIKYHAGNDFVILEYGNSSFHRSLLNQFPCQTADAWIPSLEWDNHDFLVLRYGCGSPCSGVWVLPLDSANQARNIMFEIAYDKKNNLIVYLDNESYTSMIIENLKTYQREKIEFPFKTDHGEFIGYWIENISIKDKKLFYKYSNPNEDYDKRKSTEVVIDINL
jgi:hypothetical protein